MKLQIWTYTCLIFLCHQTSNGGTCANVENNQIEQVLQLAENKSQQDELVSFDYTNESLVNIVNQLAAKQGINILFPQDLQKLEFEVSLNLPQKISISKAWGIVNTFLEIAGYTLVPKGLNYEITLSKDSNREPLATYINIHPELLPDNEDRIRYMYYLQNINLANPASKSRTNLETILKNMLSSTTTGNSYVIDAKANCLLLTNRTSNIKAAMSIIMALDQEGFREAIEIVPLKYTNSKITTDLLNKMIDNKKAGGSGARYNAPNTAQGSDDGLYFSKNTSIVAIDRSNSIAIMGNIESVERVRKFIIEHLDIPAEGGKSIIHVKELQHVDATDLSKILQRVVRAKTENMQASSRRDALSEVIITAEQESKIEQIRQLNVKPANTQIEKKPEPTKEEGKKIAMAGSNNIIIAAREPEWRILEKLIDEIDQPQIQVSIEGLIVDLYLDDGGLLGSAVRNLNPSGKPQGFNFQSSQISQNTSVLFDPLSAPVLNYVPDPNSSTGFSPTPQGLAANLLTAGELVEKEGGGFEVGNFLYQIAQNGSTLISFTDGNAIAGLLEVMKQYQNIKVLSEPFITTSNHKQAAVYSDVGRIVNGSVGQQSVGGPVIVNQDDLRAPIKIDVLPRVSRSGNINLEVIVDVDQFAVGGDQLGAPDSQNNTVLRRRVQTNANISDNQILVIGGLSQTIDNDTSTGVPILSKIPIVGNLFKQRRQDSAKRSLMIFLSPKIIKPRKGVSKLTQGKLDQIVEQITVDDLAFNNLMDPVTKILFSLQSTDENKMITKLVDQSIFEPNNKGVILKSVEGVNA